MFGHITQTTSLDQPMKLDVACSVLELVDVDRRMRALNLC